MILSTIAAFAVMGLQGGPVSCPIMGNPVEKGSATTDYDGVRFSYCCGGCKAEFEKDPMASIDKAVKDGKTIGVSLFDPISHKRIVADKAKGGFSDYKGIRFYFANKDEKAKFDKTPEKFGMLPKKDALTCAVSGEKIDGYDKADGYADYNGVRYYFCCGGCDGDFAKNPAKYAKAVADKVGNPKVTASEDKKAMTAETFSCKHCGKKMTMKDPKAKCDVCGCGKTCADCKG